MILSKSLFKIFHLTILYEKVNRFLTLYLSPGSFGRMSANMVKLWGCYKWHHKFRNSIYNDPQFCVREPRPFLTKKMISYLLLPQGNTIWLRHLSPKIEKKIEPVFLELFSPQCFSYCMQVTTVEEPIRLAMRDGRWHKIMVANCWLKLLDINTRLKH